MKNTSSIPKIISEDVRKAVYDWLSHEEDWPFKSKIIWENAIAD